jgi:hypothetical protein
MHHLITFLTNFLSSLWWVEVIVKH